MSEAAKPTGLLGGAFDPPHIGHVEIGRQSLRQLGLGRLVVNVTGEPAHKGVYAPAEIRFRLAELAFAELPEAEVSRVELDRPGPSFTLDTVRWAAAGSAEVFVIIGADQLVSFHTWHEPSRILEEACLAVAARPGVQDTAVAEAVAALDRPDRVRFFDIPDIPVSSSDIRHRVAVGEPIDGLVPEAVASHITAQGLYLDRSGT